MVTITASNTLDLSKIKLRVDDGLKQKDIKPILSNDSIIISEEITSKNVVLWVYYPKDSTSLWGKGFLLSDTEATVNFTSKDSEGNPISYCKSKNAIEYDNLKGYADLQDLIRPEETILKRINESIKYDSKTNSDSLYDLGAMVNEKSLNKKLQFVKDNSKLYYSFLLFKEEIIPNFLTLETDHLINVYMTFPEKVKNSFEGKEVLNYLKARSGSTKKNRLAPLFTSFDINKKRISLTDYQGKYVLINFWASWCGPCLGEMPMLQKINQQYSDKLQIISISNDSDTVAFAKAIKQYKMNWINIYGDDGLIDKYGRTPIPALYLLDRDGKVLFNSFEENKNELPFIIDELIKTK